MAVRAERVLSGNTEELTQAELKDARQTEPFSSGNENSTDQMIGCIPQPGEN